MEQQQLLQADYLDIIFDHRNKKYGGYDLRKHYASRASRAVAGVLIFTGIIATIPFVMSMNERAIITGGCIKPFIDRAIEVNKIYEQPTLVAPVALHTSAPQAQTNQAIAPVIVPTEDVKDLLKPVENEHAIAGLETRDGRPDATASGTGNPDDIGTGTGNIGTPGVEMNDVKPITVPDEMPTFNGNIGAYLQNHLNYPENARQIGKEGRVVIKFVVGEDGAILDASIARSVFQSLDAEALRVVKSMPKWKPGRVKGKAVKVYFSVPISFVLSDAGAAN